MDELDEFKRLTDQDREEMKMAWKETEREQKQKIDVLNVKLKALEEELTQKELLWLKKEAEVKESARQFRNEYETETERLEMKISENKIRIMEARINTDIFNLETVALERDKVIREQKENIMTENKRIVIAQDDKIAIQAELDLAKIKLDEIHVEHDSLLLEINSLRESFEKKDLELIKLNSSLAIEVNRYDELKTILEQERIQHKDEVKELELRVEQLRSELDKSYTEIHDELLATDALRKDLGLTSAKLDELQKFTDAQISTLTSNIEQLEYDKKTLQDDLTDARSRLDLAIKKNMHDLEEMGNLTDRIARLEEELSLEQRGRASESAENKAKIDELGRDLIIKMRHNEKLITNLNEAEAVNSRQLELQNWLKRNNEVELQLLEENANQELQSYRIKADRYAQHIGELMARFELFESSLEKISTENATLKAEIARKEQEKQQLKERVGELEMERQDRLMDEKIDDKENTIVEVMDLNETVRRRLDFDDTHAISYGNQSTVFGGNTIVCIIATLFVFPDF
uniref:Myosin_tail_1 domain-containing protein n=1 Tax=Heterorhabditis bacteriophora TaxID=37862 RepID=A0A1I7W7L6_HETBA